MRTIRVGPTSLCEAAILATKTRLHFSLIYVHMNI